MKKLLLAASAALSILGPSEALAQAYTPSANDTLWINDRVNTRHTVNAYSYIQTAGGGAGSGLATLAGTNAFTGTNSFVQGDLRLLGSSTGYTLLESGLSSTSNNTLLLPITSSDTLAGLGTAQTFSAADTFSGGLTASGLLNFTAAFEIGGVVVAQGTETPTATVGGSGSPTASLTHNAGSKVMEFTLASAGSATNIVVTPGFTAAHGFACFGNDVTTTTERLFNNAALSTTTATLTFYNASGTATAPGASDVIVVDCDAF